MRVPSPFERGGGTYLILVRHWNEPPAARYDPEAMKPSAEPPHGDLDPNTPVSLREAARLAGAPREYLEECIASGKLAVHLQQKGQTTKFRVSSIALQSAGIIPKPKEAPERDPNESLVKLLQDQTDRLAALEEQRFQLAGQLGAALERNRILEERVLALAAASDADESVESSEPIAKEPAQSSAPSEPPSAEPAPADPVKLAARIVRLKPPARWPSRAFGAIPAVRSLLNGKRGDSR
jgi:hypothetical protein